MFRWGTQTGWGLTDLGGCLAGWLGWLTWLAGAWVPAVVNHEVWVVYNIWVRYRAEVRLARSLNLRWGQVRKISQV